MKTSVVRLLQSAALCLLPLLTAEACGPEFYNDVFVRSAQPDLPKQFVRGRLGVLQNGFARPYLLVAYRYLNGGSFDANEQKNWSPNLSLTERANAEQETQDSPAPPAQPSEEPAAAWFALRSQYPEPPSQAVGQNGNIKVKTQTGQEYDEYYLNCASDAFRVAALTLQSRAATWGKSSAALQDWLRAQDIVFGDCSGNKATPAAAAANSPALLVQDRAYQIAAARLYSSDYAGAVSAFEAISKDTGSPWQPSAGYLAGRALIRQSFFAKPASGDSAGYDPALMQAAGRQLRSYIAMNPPGNWRRAAEALLGLVRIRTEAEQRLHELAALVGGPGHDANYQQDATDLLWLVSNGTSDGLRAEQEPWRTVPDPAHPGQVRQMTDAESKAFTEHQRDAAWDGTQPLRSQADIVDWTITIQALSAAAPAHALEQWRQRRSQAWLVAALMRTPDGTSPANDLLQAAASVPVDSPAWQTVTYHRARLLLAAHRVPEARAVLADFDAKLQAMASAEREPSTMNAVRGLRMLAAANVPEFLTYAPRTMLVSSSEEASSISECREVMKDPKRHYDCVERADPEQLDADAATVMNTQAPLSVWLAAAKSQNLPEQLRTVIAADGWARAVLLKDPHADELLSLAPPAVREQAAGPSPLASWMTLARNPGLSPYLDAGTQRAYSFDFVESFRDNWCYSPGGYIQFRPGNRQASIPPAAFLTPADKQRGAAEASRLKDARSLTVGQQIVKAVQANPKDPQAAEALYLVLRMIRYGCTEPAPAKPADWQKNMTFSQEAKDLLQLKLEAGQLLRRYYAASPWTKKAAPFVG